MNKTEIDGLVHEFESFCIKNDIAAKALNSKLANKYARGIINSYLKLKELGKTNALSKLLTSENDNVRLWAATHVLSTDEIEAKLVLEELAAKGDLNAFSAEMTLREWNNGNLKLIYEGYKVKW